MYVHLFLCSVRNLSYKHTNMHNCVQKELKQCSYMQTCVQEELKHTVYMQTCVQEELKHTVYMIVCTLFFSMKILHMFRLAPIRPDSNLFCTSAHICSSF